MVSRESLPARGSHPGTPEAELGDSSSPSSAHRLLSVGPLSVVGGRSVIGCAVFGCAVFGTGDCLRRVSGGLVGLSLLDHGLVLRNLGRRCRGRRGGRATAPTSAATGWSPADPATLRLNRCVPA